MLDPDKTPRTTQRTREGVRSEHAGMRLDVWLAETVPEISRARGKKLILDGAVLVNGVSCKPREALCAGDVVEYSIPMPQELQLVAEDIAIHVLYQDRDIIVLNKAPGMVVHPAPGHYDGTLVNALLFHCRDLEGIGGEIRPGIVHRLDKDTSGVMVVAKNDASLGALVDQFKNRTVSKEYLALVRGAFSPMCGTIKTLIGRSTRDRKKMSTAVKHGREAVSHFSTVERLGECSLMRIKIETGRTHQIRVHMASRGHPVIGDPVYGNAPTRVGPCKLLRQMLHAEKLQLHHPRTKEVMAFTAPLFPDMEEVLTYLREQ